MNWLGQDRLGVAAIAIGGGESRSLYNDFIKRLVDLSLAVVLLLLAGPLIVGCLVVVRMTSKGQPIYTQRRLGRRGQVFTIYKVRTMVQDSEQSTGPVWSGPGDPRVTFVGRFLRWSHLDELPQLINVLRGEMSLIGSTPGTTRGRRTDRTSTAELRATTGSPTRVNRHRPSASVPRRRSGKCATEAQVRH